MYLTRPTSEIKAKKEIVGKNIKIRGINIEPNNFQMKRMINNSQSGDIRQ